MKGIERKPVAFSYKEIRDKISRIKNTQDQFLFAVSYANGTRVSEVLDLTPEDIEWNDDFVYITTPVLKKRTAIVPKRSPPISRRMESWLSDVIILYVEMAKKYHRKRLIRFGKRTAQRRFDSYFHCTSHSFRHTRATHCIRYLGMSMQKVAVYFNISAKGLSDWIMRYGHLDRQDLEAHLRVKYAEEKKKKEEKQNGNIQAIREKVHGIENVRRLAEVETDRQSK